MKRKILLPLLLCLFITSFYFPVLFQNKLPIPSDIIAGFYPFRELTPPDFVIKNDVIFDPVRQLYPWRYLAINTEKQGHLPLWNPYSFSGSPLLANYQSAALYPFNILLFLVPFSFGWSMLILLEQLLAGIFMYWYLSQLKLTYPSRIIGAIAFAFCGFMTAWLEWGTEVSAAIWLPLLFLSIDKLTVYTATVHKNVRHNVALIWGLVFIFALTCSFLAGNLQNFFYVSVLTGIYFFCRWPYCYRPKKLLILFVFLLLSFLLITIIQWLPTAQYILLSSRSDYQTNGWKTVGWFIPWQNAIQFVAPDFFGNPTAHNYLGTWNYSELIGYIGIFPLLMTFYAMLYRRDKKTLFFGTLLWLSVLFSFPTYLAKLPFILNIPFLSTSQPTRLLYVTDFSLAVLASLGMDFYMRTKTKIKILYPTFVLLLLMVLLWLFVSGGYTLLNVPPENIAVMKRSLYFPTIACIIIYVFLYITLVTKNVRINSFVIALFLALSACDLFRFTKNFDPFVSRAYLYPQTSAISYLQSKTGQFRIMETDSRILPPNFSIMYHLQSLSGYDPLYSKRYGELIATVIRGIPDFHSPFGFYRVVNPTNIHSRLIDFLGVKYVLSLSTIYDPTFIKVFVTGRTRIYQNTKAFPRAFMTYNVHVVPSSTSLITDMYNPRTDLRTSGYVEETLPEELSYTTHFVNRVVITRYQENSIAICVDTTHDGLLVLTDTFYPTWHATVDGNEEKIYRTDFNFRGVIIPAGHHHVLFYDSLL